MRGVLCIVTIPNLGHCLRGNAGGGGDEGGTQLRMWEQPEEGGETFSVYDRVEYNGETWESILPSNSKEPGTKGWVKV